MLRRYQTSIKIIVTALCIFFLLRIVPVATLVDTLKRARVGPLLIVFALVVPAVLTRAWRWYLILRARGLEASLATVTKATLIGMALNLFLPASSGDIARSYYGWKRHGNKEAMLATALSDKVVALLTLCVLGALSSLYIGEYLLAAIALVLAIPMAVILLTPFAAPWRVFERGVQRLTRKTFNARILAEAFQLAPRTFAAAVGVSLIGWTATNLMYFFASYAFSEQTELWYVFAIAPFVNLMRMVPVTVAGLGSTDALLVYFLQQIGVASSEALAASIIINLALIALPGAVGGILLLLDR